MTIRAWYRGLRATATCNHNTTMYDPLVLAGSDPRLESEVEVGRDECLHFRVPPDDRNRVAMYGPYLDLPPGTFRIELEFSVSERASGPVTIELCHSGARVRLYDRPCFEWELARGFIRISYPFEQAVENLEVRLRVPNGFAGSVRQLSIQRVPDEPS